MAAAPETVHATAIELNGAGCLIRGPSGAGKSDLALRCIAFACSPVIPHQARLIADDWVCLALQDGRIILTAPPALAGKLEVRGSGIVEVAAAPSAGLALVADIVPAGQPIERIPDETTVEILGKPVPFFALHAFEPSAAIKLLLALQSWEPRK